MNFITNIFNKNKIDCPRCLGKGHVDWEDIKRLNKELKWGPGKCAFCNGKGRIRQNFEQKVSVDTTYLTSDLSEIERKKIINGEKQATLNGLVREERADHFITQVLFLKVKGNLTFEEITEFYLIPKNLMSIEEKNEFKDYIKRIVEFDNKNKS